MVSFLYIFFVVINFSSVVRPRSLSYKRTLREPAIKMVEAEL